ncbi:MAG: hypothetical protein AABX90_03840 [Nanoarchaeota archaeon]
MISNATPIICLSKINQLEILKKLFTFITVPESVKNEILVEDKPGYFIISKALAEGWIKVINPKEDVNLGLGKGENSAINLARERKDKLIIDDAFAIKVAQAFNIEIIRTTTIIFMAIKKNIITKKQAISFINKLVDIGYYISPNYYSVLLSELSS